MNHTLRRCRATAARIQLEPELIRSIRRRHSADGKYIFYAASAYSFAPEHYGLDMSTMERPMLRAVYSTVLDQKTGRPFPPLSDDEPEETGATNSQLVDESDQMDDAEKSKANVARTTVTMDGLLDRTQPVPVGREGYFSDMQCASGDKIFFLERPPVTLTSEFEVEESMTVTDLLCFDLKSRELSVFARNVTDYNLSADGKKVLVQKNSGLEIFSVTNSAKAKQVSLSNVKVPSEPVKEVRPGLAV